jgi:hypothetical protein
MTLILLENWCSICCKTKAGVNKQKKEQHRKAFKALIKEK